MTQHEVLAFVEGLHEHMNHVTGNSNVPWPTRELLIDNFRLNREIWGAGWADQYRNALSEARRRHWLVAGPGEGCSVHCHAEHIRVTAAGAQALKLMDEGGCEGHTSRRIGGCSRGFRFTRTKLAA